MISSGVFIFGGENELQTLKDFKLWLAQFKNPVLISFNGISFDVPFIIKRGELHDLDFTFLNDIEHVDLMLVTSKKYGEIVAPSRTGRISKDQCRYWMNIYEPSAGDAKHCLLVSHFKNYFPVYMHNSLDLFTTRTIFLRCLEYGWLE